jgi:hypothetical protein
MVKALASVLPNVGAAGAGWSIAENEQNTQERINNNF